MSSSTEQDKLRTRYDPTKSKNLKADEFGGPIGNSAMMICFPLLMWYMFVCYKYNDSQLMGPEAGNMVELFKNLAALAYEGAFPTWTAWRIEWGFLLFQWFNYVTLPGIWAKGYHQSHILEECVWTITAMQLHHCISLPL